MDIPLPPKIVRRHVESLLPARKTDNSIVGQDRDGESLPVLEAFQKFLDVERRKTRRRIMAVSIVALILIAVAGGAAVVAGLLLAGRVKQDVTGMQEQVAAVRAEARSSRTEVENALVTFAARTESLRAEIASAQTSGAAEVTAKIGEYNGELEKLTATLQAIEEENRILKGDVVNMKTELPALSNDIRRAVQELLKGRQLAAPISSKPVAAVAKPVGDAPMVIQDLVVAVTPADSERTVPWCIPIPE